MIRASEAEHGTTKHDRQFFMLPKKLARQRLILQLDDDTFSEPLPELSLSRPELLSVTTNNQRGPFFLGFLLVLLAHFNDTSAGTRMNCGPSMRFQYSQAKVEARWTPKGSLVREAASAIFEKALVSHAGGTYSLATPAAVLLAGPRARAVALSAQFGVSGRT
jgi:hypothetical protein